MQPSRASDLSTRGRGASENSTVRVMNLKRDSARLCADAGLRLCALD